MRQTQKRWSSFLLREKRSMFPSCKRYWIYIPGVIDSVNSVEHRHRRFVRDCDEDSSSLSTVSEMSASTWSSSERQRSTSSCYFFSVLVKRCVNVSISAFASATRVAHQESWTEGHRSLSESADARGHVGSMLNRSWFDSRYSRHIQREANTSPTNVIRDWPSYVHAEFGKALRMVLDPSHDPAGDRGSSFMCTSHDVLKVASGCGVFLTSCLLTKDFDVVFRQVNVMRSSALSKSVWVACYVLCVRVLNAFVSRGGTMEGNKTQRMRGRWETCFRVNWGSAFSWTLSSCPSFID